MKVLITGGSGFVGAHLNNYLSSKQVDIISTSRSKDNSRHEFLDITEPDSIRELIKDIDVVVNLASINGAIHTSKYPQQTFYVNSIGTLNILEAVRTYNPTARIIFMGSRLEHGTPMVLPVPTTHGFDPKTIYGISKYTATKYAMLYHKLYNLQTVVLRISNIYGPQHTEAHANYNIVNMFIEKALKNEEITLFGEGDQQRDYMHVEDICDAVWKAIKAPNAPGNVLHVGHDEPHSLKEVAHLIVDTIGSGTIVHKKWPKEWKRIETGDFYYDTGDTKKILGWQPKIGIKEGIKKVHQFYVN